MIKLVGLENIKEYWERLVNLYVECFAEPPWYEVIEVNEAEEWFREMLTYPKGMSLVFVEDEIPVGATFSFPLLYKKDVAVYVDGEIPKINVLYFSEIFVEKKYRQKGIGTFLQDKTLEMGRRIGFTHAAARTNFSSKMFSILKREFEIIGEQDVVSLKEVGGKRVEVPDKRGIFFKKL